MEDFRDLFKRSFGIEVHPFAPWETGRKKGAPSSEETPGSTGIGREFLVWLWSKAEERDGNVLLPGRGDIEIIFLRRMVLESGEGEFSESVVCQGMHAGLDEGKEALRHGKMIKEARFRLSADSDTWELTLKADQFLFQTLKLPQIMEAEEESDREGRLLERIGLIEKAAGIVDELFEIFQKSRKSPDWQAAEAARMEKWLKK